MELSLTGLRVLRAIADRGTFTAAAVETGYTQSAVSRQVAALEREAGIRLIERSRDGARLTSAGSTMLRHARVILDEVATATAELAGSAPERRHVRLGVYISAGADLLPRTLSALRRDHPQLRVTTREGTTPALVRAVRAGTLDLAIITSRPPYRPPDVELPRLMTETLEERPLLVAAPTTGHFAGRNSVGVDELAGESWIASPSTGTEPLLGVWPGLAGRPRVEHIARDWLTKLQLVAAGCGVTTVPANLMSLIPPGVTVLRVVDGPAEVRRVLVVRLPGSLPPDVGAVIHALHGW